MFHNLPNKFSLVSDDWSSGCAHYLAFFAVYKTKEMNGYQLDLIGFGPYENEESLGFHELQNYISFTLAI